MFELIQNRPQVDVPEAEYRRLLGYPKHRELEGRARELADEARVWFAAHGRPWIYAREVEELELRNDGVRIAGTDFSSNRLRDVLAEARAHSVILAAVGAGPECEDHARKLWEEGKPDEYYFLKVFGSAVVEHLIALVSGRICSRADENKMAVLPHFSPGYSGWDIGDQARLWNLFKAETNGRFPGEIEVLESGMLRPEKSLLAVFGQTRDLEKARRLARLTPCETCWLANCRYRRAPWKRSWAENVRGETSEP